MLTFLRIEELLEMGPEFNMSIMGALQAGHQVGEIRWSS